MAAEAKGPRQLPEGCLHFHFPAGKPEGAIANYRILLCIMCTFMPKFLREK